MAKPRAASNKNEVRLWDGVDEAFFLDPSNVEIVDIADYDLEHMRQYAANINLWRQLIRLSDSLKPVERRILYVLYNASAFPGKKLKSNMITGYTAVYHCHGESYPSMVGMAQNWKRQVPLIDGKGNFGSASNEMYAANRYTEASMSQYAKECFFDDYDEDCVEMVFNSACGLDEPMSLPAKFPNILVNGGMGIAFGNAFRVPPYNINDIIDVCKRVIDYPDTANVFMIPDLPTGCQIIDDGHCFHDIVETGKGVLKMRADAEIIETPKNWVIKITSIPWTTTLNGKTGIRSKLNDLARSGVISIKEHDDYSYVVKDKRTGKTKSKIDFRITFDKAHDPRVMLNKLYMLTDLQKSVSVDFKVVLDDLTVKRLSLRDLINSWIDERRSYKRRLFNKRLTKLAARIDLLDVLIELCTGSNLTKATHIIQNANEEDGPQQLMKLARMTSYQAAHIFDMKLRAFSKDAKARYIEERRRKIEQKEDLMKLIRSEKRIDQILKEELDDLRKYGTPRQSTIVAEETGTYISDTMHSIVISNNNFLKKLAYDENRPDRNFNMGSFKNGDYPISYSVVHNSSSITVVDSFGRYSIIPMHQIDNCELSQYGHSVFDLLKLSGKVVKCMETYDNDLIEVMRKTIGEPYLVTITKNGYAKKTPMSVFTDMKNSKNIRAMKIRDDDSMIVAEVMFDAAVIVIYTKKGEYTMLRVADIAEQAKDSMGLITMRVSDGDEVAGIGMIGRDDDAVVILSDKGMAKRVDKKYFGSVGRRGKASDQGSLMTLDPTDSIRFVSGIQAGHQLIVALRNGVERIEYEDLPDQTKKAKGKKLVYPSGNVNIVVANVD